MKVQVVSLADTIGSFEVVPEGAISLLQDLVAEKLGLPVWKLQFAMSNCTIPTRSTTMKAAGIKDGSIVTLVIAPNVNFLTCSDDGTVKISSAVAGDCLWKRRDLDEFVSARYAPDSSSFLLEGGAHAGEVWYAPTGTRTLVLEAVSDAVMAPDMQHLAAVRIPNVDIFVFPSGDSKCSLPCGVDFLESDDDFCGLSFSGDSSYLLVPLHGVAQVWRVKTGEHVCTVGDNMNNLSDDGTGKHTAASGDRQLYEVSCAMFHPSCDSILTGSYQGVVRQWCIASGRCTREFLGHKDVRHIALTTDGSLLAVSALDATSIWEAESGERLWVVGQRVRGCGRGEFSANGAWLLDAGCSRNKHDLDDLGVDYEIWCTKTGTHSFTLHGEQGDIMEGMKGITDARWSEFIPWLITGSADGDVQLWCPATGDCLLTVLVHAGIVHMVDCALAPSDNRDGPRSAKSARRAASNRRGGSRSRSPRAAQAIQNEATAER